MRQIGNHIGHGISSVVQTQDMHACTLPEVRHDVDEVLGPVFRSINGLSESTIRLDQVIRQLRSTVSG